MCFDRLALVMGLLLVATTSTAAETSFSRREAPLRSRYKQHRAAALEQQATRERTPSASCATYNGHRDGCNNAGCSWCGPLYSNDTRTLAKGLCKSDVSECPSCYTVTDPTTCINTADPSQFGQNCNWCEQMCRPTSDCRPCSSFETKAFCLNATSDYWIWPFTCEWCGGQCSDACCQQVDTGADCRDRKVETGLGVRQCDYCQTVPEEPPQCYVAGACNWPSDGIPPN